MFEQTTQVQTPRDAHPTPRESQRRLADLAAPSQDADGASLPAVDEPVPEGRPPDGTQTARTSGGRVGRLVERWVPPGVGAGARPRARVLVGVVVGVVVAAGVAVFVVAGGPDSESPPPLPVAHEGSADASTSASTPQRSPTADSSADGDAEKQGSGRARKRSRVVVSVVGKVHEPGLVRVPAGSRVADALDAAGGARSGADLLSVNLARKLADGEQIYVGVPVPPDVDAGGAADGDGGESGSSDAGGAGTDAGGDDQVALNSADQDELESLSGVGEVTAERILEWRADNDGFDTVEELREVDGIGEKRFEQLRDRVSVG